MNAPLSAKTHARRAQAFATDEPRVDWHSSALLALRDKRDREVQSVLDWERMRDAASQMKLHVLSRLPELLRAFADNCEANGMVVHWARDAEEHNAVVAEILAARGKRRLVKSKSMLTEETHLVPYLEARGIECIETDLGERILQLRQEAPSHIVVPAIHLKKEEIGELFHDKLGTPLGESDPTVLTHAARESLRADFLHADAAMTGVNMAIVDQGAFVVCTNEGNADMGAHLPDLHIAVMGMEKLVPDAASAALLMRMLARSATGQPSTSYNSIFGAPRPGAELHLVIVDNGRSRRMADRRHAEIYKCIRCGACINTCPVYRRGGGHSYDYFIPGPVGLAIAGDNPSANSDAWACTLNGSCDNVCPVKVPLRETIAYHREQLAREGQLPYGKHRLMPLLGFLFAEPKRLGLAMAALRTGLRLLPRRLHRSLGGAWGKSRDLPTAPPESFERWYRRHRGDGHGDA
jgi:L-lactate dehydrogenase complex protein LldF